MIQAFLPFALRRSLCAVAPHYEVSQCDGVPAHFIAIAPSTSHISFLETRIASAKRSLL
ncbi:hypothetical protein [Nostoc sp. ChiQUE01b]|uniref:hypothetical protein n=1 Tax=Nostoc sp. ChiQUE01b TaxID=3075376 RepID=UPI002AD429A1|nr:hypothetical protein [Nostoc sp. ChiQUE01b]MDZ8259879.1 hypothetical protein [Nostoc sp. ChiQUE01b]